MKALKFQIDGNWAHFKKPETNNNPLTHDFITKTALIGLIGAVLGIERDVMRPLFPQLSEDLLYGVEILNRVNKQSWAFTMRRAVNVMEKAPKQMEFLRNPGYTILIGLANQRSEGIFEQFSKSLSTFETKFPPVLGLHNCPANLGVAAEFEMSEKQNGSFETKGFISRKHRIDVMKLGQLRLGLERIPTYQNDDFWNLPEHYVEVVYPSEGKSLTVTGDYYQAESGECWWLT